MAYEANRGDSFDCQQQNQRNAQNNAKNIRNAADVAIASKNPYAMAAGGAVKLADKVSGGRATQAMGKAMNTANRIAPGGRQIQNASNHLSESGASDRIGQAASIKNRVSGSDASGAASSGAGASGTQAGAVNNNGNVGGGQSSSLPSSSEGRSSSFPRFGGLGSSLLNRRRRREEDEDSSEEESGSSSKGIASFLARQALITIALTVGPFLLLILLFIMIIALVSGIFNDYEDAFGMSYTVGEETGGLEFSYSSKEQQEFYDRINEVKLNYQAQGKTLDAMAIVGVFHSLQANGVDIHYEDVTTSVIQEWANASFDGNTYSEDVFRNNLINSIFPKWKKNETKEFYEQMADEVFDYMKRYQDLIGNGMNSALSTGEFSTWKQGDSAWGSTPMGTSGKTLSQIGCLVTSVSMLIAKSGVPVSISPFNPGTFVEFLNKNGGINSGGNFIWGAATKAAPTFKYQGQVSVSGMSRAEKFNKIKSIVSQSGVYAVAEVKGNTGQHWVAIDGISGDTINMMDPSSSSTDMWSQYNWSNTSTIAYYKVG